MCETCGCAQHEHNHQQKLISVRGMEGEDSAKALEDALNDLPGIHAAVDCSLGVVSILLHENSDLEAARAKIIELGYEI
jgi:hypothetical protein